MDIDFIGFLLSMTLIRGVFVPLEPAPLSLQLSNGEYFFLNLRLPKKSIRNDEMVDFLLRHTKMESFRRERVNSNQLTSDKTDCR